MKRFALLSIVVLSALMMWGCAAQSPAPAPVPSSVNKDWTATMKWSFDFTNYFVCSAAATKGCVTGFTWGYLDGANQIPLKTLAVSAGSGVQNFTDVTNVQLPIGSLTGYVVMNYVDSTGVASKSAPGTAAQPTPVPAGVASNVTLGIS